MERVKTGGGKEEGPAGVLQLADENLYRAKRQSRNACVLHGADYDSLRTGRFRHTD
jgi:hypothetical protein